MITVVNTTNQGAYRDLFIDASNLLLGFESIRVYDRELTEYFIKPDTDTFSFKAVEINSQGEFENCLQQGELFKKAHYDVTGVEVDPIELGFISADQKAEENDTVTFNTYGITTLEEYFSWLYKIKEIGEAYILKYTILPLDEPHFEINANTRAIQIPTDFKKNGIAVQGDDLAEVVYFKIDRYFDAVDFNACEIYVQWELPKAKTKGVSPVSIKDVASEPGKLIFGWPISRDITKEAGNLKFSVQFYQLTTGTEEAKVNYSFNTLTAQVTIQNSIGLDISDKDSYYEDDIGTRLNDRIQPSIIVGGAQADEPKFYTDEDFTQAYYDMKWDTENGEYNTYVLQTQAYASDAGGMSYRWKMIPLTEDNKEIDNDISNIVTGVSEEYVEVPVDELKAGRVYYIRTGTEGDYRYERYTTPIPVTDEAMKAKTFCKKVGQCLVNTAGCYQAIAENRITNNSRTGKSLVAKFLKPTQAEIKEMTVSNGGIIDDNHENCVINVKATNTDPEVLTYQWYRNPAIKANFVDNPTAEFEPISGATAAALTATETGHYRVDVINNRNNVQRITASEYKRITGPAVAPVITNNTNLGFTPESIDVEAGNCPKVILDGNVESDQYKVEWHVWEDGNDNVVTTEMLPNPEGYALESRFDPRKPEYLDIITGKDSEPNIFAYFYAKVTNYWNGQEVTTGTPAPEDMFRVYPTNVAASMLLDEEDVPVSKPVTLDLDSKLPFEDED